MSGRLKRILVVEDNPALSRITSFNLEQAGYCVTEARSGREAWELLEQEHYDLVVTDQQMSGMTGWELCRRMRQSPAHRDTPVIFLTAKELEFDPRQLVDELSVAKVIAKPFSPRELIEFVDELSATLPAASLD
jgi:CheY-like chemotaxis protein